MIAVRPYTAQDVSAVQDFNRRLRDGGAPPEFTFSQSPVPRWLPPIEGRTVYNEFFLAFEGAFVRGAYALKTQVFSFAGETRPIGYYHHPFSEGIVNRNYAGLGVQLLRDAQRRKPELYALGMGGYDRPLPRMLVAMKWAHYLVPFYVRVMHPYRFLRGMRGLRRSGLRSLAMDVAAMTGAGWAGLHAVQTWRGREARGTGSAWEPVPQFGDWADELWQNCGTAYAMCAARDAATLNVLFPEGHPAFLRVRVRRSSETIGWAVVAQRKSVDHPETGQLRVGVVVDVLAKPADALAVVHQATAALAKTGVDLITSNQSHPAWADAFRRAGYLPAPSNFIFAVPPTLGQRLPPLEGGAAPVHLTRADGDGLYQYD